MNCDYLVPDFSGGGIPVGGEDTGECLLKEGHEGEHLVRTFYGYYLWLPLEYPCEGCDCEGIDCYTYRRIPSARAEQILAKNSPGTD